jgi:hypothetical protein
MQATPLRAVTFVPPRGVTTAMIEGDAGVGKSRVVKRAVAELRARGKIVLVTAWANLPATAFERGTSLHRAFSRGIETDDYDNFIIALRSEGGTVSPERLALLRAADALFIDEGWSGQSSVMDAVLDFLNRNGCNLRLVIDGDAQQILPVAESRIATLQTSLLSSKIYRTLHAKFVLTVQWRMGGDGAYGTFTRSLGNGSACAIAGHVHEDATLGRVAVRAPLITNVFHADDEPASANDAMRRQHQATTATVAAAVNASFVGVGSHWHMPGASVDDVADGADANRRRVDAAMRRALYFLFNDLHLTPGQTSDAPLNVRRPGCVVISPLHLVNRRWEKLIATMVGEDEARAGGAGAIRTRTYESTATMHFDDGDEIGDAVGLQGLQDFAEEANANEHDGRNPNVPRSSLTLIVGGEYLLADSLVGQGLAKNQRVVVADVRWQAAVVEVTSDPRPRRQHTICRRSFRISVGRKGGKGKQEGFVFLRKQLPFIEARVLTPNKAQGQTLERILLDVTRPQHAHGSGYVGPSRVRKSASVGAFVDDPSSERASAEAPRVPVLTNIVYTDLLKASQLYTPLRSTREAVPHRSDGALTAAGAESAPKRPRLVDCEACADEQDDSDEQLEFGTSGAVPLAPPPPPLAAPSLSRKSDCVRCGEQTTRALGPRCGVCERIVHSQRDAAGSSSDVLTDAPVTMDVSQELTMEMVDAALTQLFAAGEHECRVETLLDSVCEAASATFTIDELEPVIMALEEANRCLYRETDGVMYVHDI